MFQNFQYYTPDMNPIDHSVWGLLQDVYKICINDLDEPKQ